MRSHAIGPETGEEARFALLLLMALSLIMSLVGCRRDPAKPTEMYERERTALAAPAVKEEKEAYLPDPKPVEGLPPAFVPVAVDLVSTRRRLEAEGAILESVVHSCPRCCPQPLPPRCPPPSKLPPCANSCLFWPLRR